MDFLKCSQVYGYKSIAEVEEEKFAEKLVEHDKDIARNMLADGDSVEKVTSFSTKIHFVTFCQNDNLCFI